MTNSSQLNLARQLKIDALQVVDACFVGTEPLNNGDTAHIQVDIALTDDIKNFSSRLLIFDSNWNCAVESSLNSFDDILQRHYRINFYFLIDLKPGPYIATFEFFRGMEISNDCQNSVSLLGRYNCFIEFTIRNYANQYSDNPHIEQHAYPRLSTTTSIHPINSRFISSKIDNATNSVEEMPWPQPEEQVSLADLSAALKQILLTTKSVESNPIVDSSLLTPHSYDRKFFPGQPPMRSRIGIADPPGLRSNGSPGYLLFGPYLSALPGRYEVIFEGRAGSIINQDAAVFDVVARKGILIYAEVTPVLISNENFRVQLEFEIAPPGVVDLELRVNLLSGANISVDDILLKSLLNKSARSTQKIEQVILSSFSGSSIEKYSSSINAEHAKRDQATKLVLIFIPNEVFTICGLIIAYHLLRKSNSQTILVSEGQFNKAINTSLMTLCGIKQCILFENIKHELLSSRIDVLITHSENSLWQTKILLKQLTQINPHIELQAYSDGFRNAANPEKLIVIHPITKLYFFGMQNFSMNVGAGVAKEIIDFEITQRILTRVAQAHNFLVHEPSGQYEKYSVFCLRYWGLEGYNFPSNMVGESWYATISAYTPKDELVIIKGGGGQTVNNEGYTRLKNLLIENGYAFLDAEDYLFSCGMPLGSSNSSLENLLYFGMFPQATRFFSLDSSLPVILAQLDFIPRPIEIICGGKNIQDFKSYSGFHVLARNLNQLRKSFVNTPFFDPYQILDEDQTLFKIKLL